jgi:hypothetical protein
VKLGRSRLTDVYVVAEPFLSQWGILLDVALVVIERAVLSRLQLVGVFDHLHIQAIENSVVDHVFQHDQAIARQCSNGNLKVALAEAPIFAFSISGTDRDWRRWKSGGHVRSLTE